MGTDGLQSREGATTQRAVVREWDAVGVVSGVSKRPGGAALLEGPDVLDGDRCRYGAAVLQRRYEAASLE